ncbi:hypothetical protein [Methanoplanus endosymbiosus]|uniref:Uncharacterized protein n=1 Tax=Methanoplanus endosymbiosus TaxID=33865 RepID=A0A9E7TIX0_9EURY|nr:hypothetical protein [Methanoplanus endosymbiosus]UUX91274.1 hypothetical protein L6E24_07755 [Methanoplanus endosymbiosus]
MHSDSEGMTVLELLILTGLFLIFIGLFGGTIYSAFFGSDAQITGGIVSGSVRGETTVIYTEGSISGYEDICGTFDGVELYTARPDSRKLGSILLPVKTTISSYTKNPVDIRSFTVMVYYSGSSETLTYSEKNPLEKPAWTVAQRSGYIPLQDADDDYLIESNEIFDILVYPGSSLPPGANFGVEISSGTGIPLKEDLTVPPQIDSREVVILKP